MFELLLLPRFATLAVLAALLGLGSGAARALYDVEPGEIPGRPGTLIRIWPLEGGSPGVRGGKADAFRILYRSTNPRGQPIPVSGAIFIPTGPAPAGGRNIIKLCPIKFDLNQFGARGFLSGLTAEIDAIEALMKRAEANEARFTS